MELDVQSADLAKIFIQDLAINGTILQYPAWLKIQHYVDLIQSGLLQFQSKSILDPLPHQTEILL
jgi:hypothetical protein